MCHMHEYYFEEHFPSICNKYLSMLWEAKTWEKMLIHIMIPILILHTTLLLI